MPLVERSYNEYAYRSMKGGTVTVTDVKVSGRAGQGTCPVCHEKVKLDGSLRVTLCEEDLPGWWDIHIHEACYGKVREAAPPDAVARLFGG